METPQKNFLILNAFIVTLVVISFFLLRRSPKAPVKLELRSDDEVKSDQARDAKVVPSKPRPKFTDPRLKSGPVPTGWNDYQPRKRQVYGGVAGEPAPPAPNPKPKAPFEPAQAKTELVDDSSAEEDDTAPGRAARGAGTYSRSGSHSAPPPPASASHRSSASHPAREKSLNVLFNWNGHTWDAYEVLGIPAGASYQMAHDAFVRAAALADQETVPFLRAAMDSIARS